MTPDQISGLNAVAMILQRMGTWPISSIVALVVLGPWAFQFFISRSQESKADAERSLYKDKFDQVVKQQEKRFEQVVKMYEDSRSVQEKKFEAVVRMYESNVDLVKDYQGIAKNLQDIVLYNTQVMQEVIDISKNNLHCPFIRKQIKPEVTTG